MAKSPPTKLDSALKDRGKEGVLRIGEKGDRRIRLSDLANAVKSNDERVYLSLDQILFGGAVTLEGPDREVSLTPINLNALAEMERRFGDLSSANLSSMDAIRSIATILANQSRPIGDHHTEHDVGAMLTPDIIAIVTALISDLMSPLSAESGVTSAKTKTPRTPPRRPIGVASSTSSLRSSAGAPMRLQNSL